LPDSAPAPDIAAAPVGLGGLHGWVDEASHERIRGWVADTADASRSVGLLITANGQPIGRVAGQPPSARPRGDRPGRRRRGDVVEALRWTRPSEPAPQGRPA
jgi:hypothetical protein